MMMNVSLDTTNINVINISTPDFKMWQYFNSNWTTPHLQKLSQLDRLFSIWNNAIHCMNLSVHTAGTYRATAILGRVHTAFFNFHYFSKMTNMPDKIVLAYIMTVLDLEFERTLHYHNEGYDNDNDYWLSAPVMKPVHIDLVSTTETSFNPTDYKGA